MRKGLLAAGVLMTVAAAAAYAMDIGRPRRQPVAIGTVLLSPVDLRTVEGFKAGLAERGYREGEAVIYRHSGPAGQVAQLDAMIEAQVAQGLDLLVASSTPAAQAAARILGPLGIPVIFAPVNDPVAAGIVDSLARPGGLVTGVKLPAGDDLRLQWLTRIAPDVRTVLLPYNPADASALKTVAIVAEAARRLDLTLHLQPVATPADLAARLEDLPPTVQAIFLPRDSMVGAEIDLIVEQARRRRLPVVAPSLQQVERGALFAYGFSHRDIGRQAARLAVPVLGGVPPGNIPVETAENRLVINLEAAAAIGRQIPDEVLALADCVRRGP